MPLARLGLGFLASFQWPGALLKLTLDSDSSWETGSVPASARRTAVTVECRNTSSLWRRPSYYRSGSSFLFGSNTLPHSSIFPLGRHLTHLQLRNISPLTTLKSRCLRPINQQNCIHCPCLWHISQTYLIRPTPSPIPLFPPTEHTRDRYGQLSPGNISRLPSVANIQVALEFPKTTKTHTPNDRQHVRRNRSPRAWFPQYVPVANSTTTGPYSLGSPIV